MDLSTANERLNTLTGDDRRWATVDDYIELILTDEEGESHALGLAAWVSEEDQKVYLSALVGLYAEAFGEKEEVDESEVVGMALGVLGLPEAVECHVSDIDLLGDPDGTGDLRSIADEDEAPLDAFEVQLSPAPTLEELSDDLVRELIARAPFVAP
jgi:hypothetical protein